MPHALTSSIFCFLFSVLCLLILTETTKAELVGWWRFDEGSGTTAQDTSGHGNGGVLNGDPQWVAGHFGGALEFDGSDGYVDCGSDPSLDLTAWTVTFWLNLNQNKDYNAYLVKGLDAAENYEILTYGDGHFHFPIMFTDGSRGYAKAPAGICIVGEWAHYTYSYNSAEGRRFYKDGVLVFEDTESKTPRASTSSLTIGNEQAMPRHVNGIMDDIRIYSTALSEPEILAAMEGGKGYPYALGPDPKDGALIKSTWVTLGWSAGDFAVSHDVFLGEDYDGVSSATRDSEVFRGNQVGTFSVAGFPGYPYPDGLVPGTTYYWRIDEVNDADPNSPWKGAVWRFSVAPKTAYDPVPADGAEFVDPNALMLSWTPGFGAKLHTVYFGDDFDDVNDAAGGAPGGMTNYSPGSLERRKVYYWRVDEFDAVATYKGYVWSFTTPGAVGNPKPAYGATDVGMNVTLTWTPADYAASHQLYFGAGKDAVRNADTGAPEYKGSRALGVESYDPGLLEADGDYYWCVDEVDGQGNTAKGPLWVFTTGDFLLVDDFESYTDDDAAGQAIWQTWIDGFGIADNGAQVGYLMPPYTEKSIVHGGSQSMPLLYVNEAGVTNSEATMTLTAPRDWSQAGVGELSLWFRGASGNAAEPLYVAVSNNSGAPAVAAYGDPGAATVRSWTQWVISLQAFADQGINLSNVDKLAIGLGTKGGAASGGSGTMYIDDIRLKRP
ncbi:MAG: hypothetical protein A2Z25_11740 [Planctomycetes bacterium RBG_16_55_9]|nr:MAG: hypothetical protein A2Z25_11740 [Planctomycetes bacterium RBG_16_55_9]